MRQNDLMMTRLLTTPSPSAKAHLRKPGHREAMTRRKTRRKGSQLSACTWSEGVLGGWERATYKSKATEWWVVMGKLASVQKERATSAEQESRL